MRRQLWSQSPVGHRVFAIGIALGFWCVAPAVHADTLTIAATPSVVEEVEALAQAFEASHPKDRVQIAMASEDELKSSGKRLPVQLIVSDNPSFFAWLEARDIATRMDAGPAVHVPLAVVSASTTESIETLRDLRTRLFHEGTRVAIPDPAKTDCGRRAADLLKSIGVTPTSPQVLLGKHTAQVVELVRTGKAQLGIVFAPEAVVANGVTVHAVSSPQAGSPVHMFAVKRGQREHHAAKRFLAFAGSPEGQQALRARGYEILRAQAVENNVPVVAMQATHPRQ